MGDKTICNFMPADVREGSNRPAHFVAGVVEGGNYFAERLGFLFRERPAGTEGGLSFAFAGHLPAVVWLCSILLLVSGIHRFLHFEIGRQAPSDCCGFGAAPSEGCEFIGRLEFDHARCPDPQRPPSLVGEGLCRYARALRISGCLRRSLEAVYFRGDERPCFNEVAYRVVAWLPPPLIPRPLNQAVVHSI